MLSLAATESVTHHDVCRIYSLFCLFRQVMPIHQDLVMEVKATFRLEKCRSKQAHCTCNQHSHPFNIGRRSVIVVTPRQHC